MQIVMSVSWNLDIEYPPPFSSLLSSLSFLSLDFLALECYNDDMAVQDRYFTTVLLWSILPLALLLAIGLVFLLRLAVATASHRGRSLAAAASARSPRGTLSSVDGYAAGLRTASRASHQDAGLAAGNNAAALKQRREAIWAQHGFTALLLSYLILPPVAMKQLQALDCIPFPHDGSSFLRVDTAVDCASAEYAEFRVAVVLFAAAYQSVPVAWFALLWRERRKLNPPAKPDKRLALFIRDQDRSLDALRFLFNDYRCTRSVAATFLYT